MTQQRRRRGCQNELAHLRDRFEAPAPPAPTPSTQALKRFKRVVLEG